MSGLTAYMEQSYINSMLRGAVFPAPALNQLHLALFTADPTDAGALANEVPTGSWYVRQPVSAWSEPIAVNGADFTGHETFNLARIDFPVVVGDEVTVTHMAIMDAAVGGNMLLTSNLKKRKILEADDQLSFAIGTSRFSIGKAIPAQGN